ncbi:MAG: glycosyltransferase family 39 protein [Pontiellaceae bacterium]|nr:glycosyltransferase family 39 protein [Pontiellaceae bacterium]
MNTAKRLSEKNGTILALWALAHLALWTLIPVLCNTCLPLDSIEASMWGSQWAWGYDKHPPLSGWLAYIASSTAGDAGVYFLAQLCVVIAGLGIYRLARLLSCSPSQSVLAVLSIDLVFFYTLGAVEFNVNVVQMPFWAWGWYFGMKGLHRKSVASWCSLGVCVALGALTKYIAVFMLVPLFATWWFRGELRQALRSPGLYVAGFIAILLFIPHLLWMMNHDWITIRYGLGRGGGEHPWWHHLWHPVEFVLGQAGILLPALGLAVFYGRKTAARADRTSDVAALAFGAYLFLALIALATGMAPVTMWAAPFPLAIGLWLVRRYPIAEHPRPFLWTVVGASILYAAAYIVVYGLSPVLRDKPHRVNYPGPELAEAVEKVWTEISDEPFCYIIADEWFGGIVNTYGESEPAVVIEGDFKLATFLTEDEVRKHGALVFWQRNRDHERTNQKSIEQQFPQIVTAFETIEPLPDLIIPWPRRTDGKAGLYGLAYIPPSPTK